MRGLIFREICIRIRVTSDDAGYIAAKWPNMEQEYLTWKDLLDNQVNILAVYLIVALLLVRCRCVITKRSKRGMQKWYAELVSSINFEILQEISKFPYSHASL